MTSLDNISNSLNLFVNEIDLIKAKISRIRREGLYGFISQL